MAFNPNDLWDPNYQGPIPGPRGEEADERWWDPRSWDAPATGTDGSSRPDRGAGGFNPNMSGVGSEPWTGGSRYGGWGELGRSGIGGWGGAANKALGLGLGIKGNFKTWEEKHPGENAFKGRLPDNTRTMGDANQIGPGALYPGGNPFGGGGEPMTYAEYLMGGMNGDFNLNIY